MRSFLARGAVLLTSLFVAIAQATPETAPQLNLPEKFAPPPVFKNTNLLRNIDLTKPYQREVIAVVVENISKEPQTDYYIPFDKEVAERISYIEARDKAGVLGFLDVAKAQSPR
jgi:oligosaccharyltransferase complex subunit alpha (ribophorin I)